MSTLTSSSTDTQVWAAYDDNASYEEDGSRTKALAFLTACIFLIRRKPKRMFHNQRGSDFDEVAIRDEMDAARKWIALNPASTTAAVRFGDLIGFRD